MELGTIGVDELHVLVENDDSLEIVCAFCDQSRGMSPTNLVLRTPTILTCSSEASGTQIAGKV